MCSRAPLLARAGRHQGRPFLWVKNYRAKLDIVIGSGSIQIKCRECLRWHTITVGERVESKVK